MPRARASRALSALAAALGAAAELAAQTPAPVPEAPPPPLVLRPAREIAPAAAPVPAPAPGTRASAPQRPRVGTADDTERGIVFLRADRLEGVAEREVRAEGRVELRARRETVLADRLVYDLERDELRASGNVVLRQGVDWITGPELVYKRDDQTGSFESPKFSFGQTGARGDASKITFAGPDRYDVADGRYTKRE